ncbi:methyl-accepting chemotaxis protein [Blastopirellula marina]|uniref:Methyl-accepting chemotaxis protein n=1 Tax=Blastopirellula marina TaxID=124 RepID=A0A2S8GPK5_9BACT|nr:methyl-accepting chemotaxis protein [Blastopirellula marina]PQO46373.1 hypothetical protein C5Y93_10350 [Blastopirellula marina]
MLNRLNIMQKTILGFGAVLLLMVVSSAVAWKGIQSASTGFARYQNLTADVDLSTNILQTMTQLRSTARRFDFTGDAKEVQRFNDTYTELQALLQKANDTIDNPQRREWIAEMIESTQGFGTAFQEIVQHRQTRDELWSGVLSQKGAAIAKNLLNVIDLANKDEDSKAALAAGKSLNNLMQMRVSVYRLLYTTDLQNDAATTTALGDLLSGFEQQEANTESPERKTLLADMIADTKTYQVEYRRLADNLVTERNLVKQQLNILGPRVGELATNVSTSLQEVQKGVGIQVNATNQFTSVLVTVVSVVALIIGGVLAVLLSRSIVMPIRRVMTILGSVSEGDLRKRLEVTSHDEIGKMSDSLNHMVENLQKAMTALSENSHAISKSASDMNSTADNMTTVSQETKTQSTSAAAASEELSVNMRRMSESATDMSKNMDMVASAIEEMSISISQIASSMDQVSHVASEAHRLTDGSRTLLGELNAAANEIGDVVELIQDIAEQTNLLALNATIEAARAGEAGKGFAVVAGEVKELARQTGDATGDIERRVSSMQAASTESMRSIDAIREVVEKLNSIAQTVAASVEEQSATTQEIAGSVARTNSAVQQVSQSVNESAIAGEEIARSVTSVDSSALRVSQGAGETKSCSGVLSGISSELQVLVGQFQI